MRYLPTLKAWASGVLVACWLGTPAFAQVGLGDLEYGYPDIPPRAFVNAKGEADGHYIRLLGALMTRAGLSWHPVNYPAPRLMMNLRSGNTAFAILVRNPLLGDCCLYSKQPFWYDELRAYWTGSKPTVARKEDLVGKSVIILSGFGYGGLLSYFQDPANRMVLHTAETHEAAFAMLDAGRADYVIDYAEAALADGLARHPIAGVKSGVIDVLGMYLTVSRANPQAETILARLEAAYQQLWAEDTAGRFTKR